jgi:glycerate dehydrogenase
MKAALLDWATMGPGLDLSELRALLPELEVYDETDDDQIADRIAGADIVIGNKVLIVESLFAGAPQMRFIGLTATGTDNVDLNAAKQHGVAVANIRAYCSR